MLMLAWWNGRHKGLKSIWVPRLRNLA